MDSALLLRLLQLVDSSFPTGAFAFSHGLEGLAATGMVRDEAGVADLMRAHVEESFGGIEAPAAWFAYRAAAAGDVSGVLTLDDTLTALKPVPAFRTASSRTGRRFLESTVDLVGGPVLHSYRVAVMRRCAAGHHALGFAVVMEAAGLDAATTVAALGASFVGGLAAAAVRLGVIGQMAAQRIIADLHPTVLIARDRAATMAVEEMGAYLPLVDVAGLRQGTLPGRLFGS